jgi:hypothetical protein
LPAGLTLSSSGAITGTPTNQGTQSFTVRVSDSQTPPATATANLSLTINGPTGRLNGNYAFSFFGYQNGAQVLQAGSFSADGAGNISNGLMDSNSTAGVHIALSFTGTYSLDSTNTGPMTLTIPGLGTFTYQVAAPASGTIRFIQNGTAGNQGSGVILKNSSATAITISQLAGFWSFGASGSDAAASRYHRLAHSRQVTRVHGATSKSTQTMTATRLTAPPSLARSRSLIPSPDAAPQPSP